jgi:hypothetical protein
VGGDTVSSREVSVSEAHKYVGRYVSGTFSDGWDDWGFRGKLIDVQASDPYIYLEICEDYGGSEPCELCGPEWTPGDHGGFGFGPHNSIYVHVGGRR